MTNHDTSTPSANDLKSFALSELSDVMEAVRRDIDESEALAVGYLVHQVLTLSAAGRFAEAMPLIDGTVVAVRLSWERIGQRDAPLEERGRATELRDKLLALLEGVRLAFSEETKIEWRLDSDGLWRGYGGPLRVCVQLDGGDEDDDEPWHWWTDRQHASTASGYAKSLEEAQKRVEKAAKMLTEAL